jgi:hypothetical protein
MGGRGSKARSRVDAHAPGQPQPEQPTEETPAQATPEAPAEAPTEQVEPTYRPGVTTAENEQEEAVLQAVRAAGAPVRVGVWQRLADLRAALPPELSRAEVDAMLKRMARAGEIETAPDPDRKSLKQEDHDNALHRGSGDHDHLVIWAPRDPDGALHRVREGGVRAVSDDDLIAAMRARDVTDDLYRELHNENNRRRTL